MRILELFSGTGSVGRAASEMGHEVMSLDISNKYNPTFVANVLEFDFSIFPRGYYDLIWASPPCEKYSIAPCHMLSQEERRQRAEEANAVTRKTLEVIETLRPKWFAIENPASSAMWKQGIFDHLPKPKKVSYCMYSTWGYRKNTYICTNIPFENKYCKGDCGYIQTFVHDGKTRRHHISVAKQGVSAHCKDLGVQNTTHSKYELYRVPEKLIKDILQATSTQD